MKILLVGPANSIHLQKWANGLSSRHHEVHLASCHHAIDGYNSKIIFHKLSVKAPFGYALNAWRLSSLAKDLVFDVINIHYATGYGLLGLLARLKRICPVLLSVWGSDVYDFPVKSWLHQKILTTNLQSAIAIASTSYCMKKQTQRYIKNKEIFVTPFGIDESLFSPQYENKQTDAIRIGTVKTLKYNYGIDTLIEAFALVLKETGNESNISLEIYGGGPDHEKLVNLSCDLGIADKVHFHAFIEHKDVPNKLNQLEIYVALSRFESFGVAILEASSCALPVVVSDADGLKEVVIDNYTGFVVPKDSPNVAANKIIELITNDTLRHQLGENGRQHVIDNYTWEKSLDIMIDVYSQTIVKFKELGS